MPLAKPPTKSKSKPSAATDFDSYLLEGDLSDISNPFRSPSPPTSSNPTAQPTKKRSKPTDDHLGISSEVTVKKRAVAPRVKLDETRLLSSAGIPTVQKRAKKLVLKGKGHEWSDASRLLSMYQLWLDDLFPKAQFLDALGMVEKAGHKGMVQKARLEWIEEGRPKAARDFEVDGEEPEQEEVERQPSRIAPIFERAKTTDKPGTSDIPDDMDLFGDGDIHIVTPKRTEIGGGEPDDEDLDALMAVAEADGGLPPTAKPPFKSIFGGDDGKKPASSLFGPKITADAPDEDDLDALMAEAEGSGPDVGGGKPKTAKGDDDLGDDDLDALMAEEEAAPKTKTVETKEKELDSFAADEEAMAEMDGLW